MVTTTPAPERPQRPMYLSADKRKISYKSKNGNIFTLEFKNSQAVELKNSKAVDSLREIAKANPAKAIAADESKPVDPGLWYGVYDTVAMLIEESLEVACFGPYDEPGK